VNNHARGMDDSIAAGPGALGIADSAFTLLRDLIEQHLGVFYDTGKRDLLVDRISAIISAHGMQSFLDYYYALKYDADAEKYWIELMNQLSVPETYFWRQPDHFEALVENVLPEHLALKQGQTLRIWSAACCTGEEPLSIAMALTEAGAFERTRVEIIASDASQAMVDRARRGVYGERSFRSLPPHLREKYFTPSSSGWQVRDDLMQRIDWRVINLVNSSETAAVAKVDVAFCRNVLIYFSDDAIRRVAHMLSTQMRAGGRLFLGAAESLNRIPSNFVLTELGRALVYVNHRTEPAFLGS
jgi:chemotaxis protein methyltransferase CheR